MFKCVLWFPQLQQFRLKRPRFSVGYCTLNSKHQESWNDVASLQIQLKKRFPEVGRGIFERLKIDVQSYPNCSLSLYLSWTDDCRFNFEGRRKSYLNSSWYRVMRLKVWQMSSLFDSYRPRSASAQIIWSWWNATNWLYNRGSCSNHSG